MNNTQYIFVNGILSNPEDVTAWTDRAEEWIDKNTLGKARCMEYRSGALTRRLHQGQRVKNLKTICKAYLGDKIVLVGHSNGCDIISRMMGKGLPVIHQIHLIAAACEHDFKKNNLNHALKGNQVKEVFVYTSPVDAALKKAKATSFLRYVGLGYGYLGLVGPLNVHKEVADRVHVISEDMGHSQWFSKKHFEQTMNIISGKTPYV